MTTAPQHTLETDVDGVVKILRSALALPGWTEDFYLMYAAGVLLESEIMTTEYRLATIEDGKKPITMTLTEKQRDACKACINHFREKKNLPSGPHLNKILVGLGLVDPAKA